MFEKLRSRRLEREFSRGLAASLALQPDSDATPNNSDDVGRQPLGPEVYRLDDEELWSVRDDTLADRLGLRSHHAAERKVRDALAKTNPELLSRCEFGSEADCFFAYFESEADARAILEFLLQMS